VLYLIIEALVLGVTLAECVSRLISHTWQVL